MYEKQYNFYLYECVRYKIQRDATESQPFECPTFEWKRGKSLTALNSQLARGQIFRFFHRHLMIVSNET